MANIPIGDLADHLGEKLERVARGVKIAVFSEAVNRTIVDTGRLRSNWMISEGSPSDESSERTDTSAPEREIEAMVEGDDAATQHWLTNNLPYAGVINERDNIVGGAASHVEAEIRSIASRG